MNEVVAHVPYPGITPKHFLIAGLVSRSHFVHPRQVFVDLAFSFLKRLSVTLFFSLSLSLSFSLSIEFVLVFIATILSVLITASGLRG